MTEIKECAVCGMDFETRHGNAKTCSKRCSALYQYIQRYRKANREYTITNCVTCGGPHVIPDGSRGKPTCPECRRRMFVGQEIEKYNPFLAHRTKRNPNRDISIICAQAAAEGMNYSDLARKIDRGEIKQWTLREWYAWKRAKEAERA